MTKKVDRESVTKAFNLAFDEIRKKIEEMLVDYVFESNSMIRNGESSVEMQRPFAGKMLCEYVLYSFDDKVRDSIAKIIGDASEEYDEKQEAKEDE